MNCLRKISEEERKYEEVLKRFSEEMVKKGVNVSFALNKIVENRKHGLLVKYSGLKVIFKGVEDQKLADKIILPPKFIYDGLEYVVHGEEVLCEYSVFRKFSKVLNCNYVVVANIDVNDFLRNLCNEASIFLRKISAKIEHIPQWVPLFSSGIVGKLSKKYRMKMSDIRDYIVYLYDEGKLPIKFGETGELWLNFRVACRSEY